MYEANRMEVIRQFSYESDRNYTLDMVLSINGIPMVALELKNQLTGQTIDDAKNQYIKNRNPREKCFQSNKRVLDFDFLDYPVTEMTDEQIKATIKAFGEATRRAYEAGFDGVEIHGANHYLIQQFFSNYSNHRTDNWGGSFDKRMNFPLAVVEEVKQVVQHFENNFIVGYRISPEEIHGITIGYDYKESAELVKKLERYGLDYIHISNFDKFDMGPEGLDGSYVELYKKAIGNETPLITVSNVFTQADVENALALADIVAIGRAALLDPEFTHKLTHQRKDEIVSEMSEDVMAYVKWPQGLYDWYRDGAALPQVPNLESLL
ncbi:oxidoreductase [Fundicoccus sp. Sow4_D5]|uniref:oxidoreductase n=1 Tax=Fundicoccus sp. Sow4_D5 TaxID=3438782 RepID=UPI003F91AF34